MNFSAQELMEKIIELRIQLDYQIVETPLEQTEDNIQYNAKELIYHFELLKYNYPEEFKQFLDFNPKYKPLDVISKDNAEGLQQIISCIYEDKEKTVAAIVKQVQTHQFHQWVNKNSKQEVASVCETEADHAVYIHMSQFNLPQVKQEEIGDCIALAFTGILSDNASIFNNPNLLEENKRAVLKKLLVDNRKYINWDFKSLTIEDQTDKYIHCKNIYKPRGVAAKKMIDSTYTDGKHLFAVISTSNSDTSSQGAQAFEIYKTLQSNFEKQRLDLELETNLTPSVILFNSAFFCTENPEKIVHTAGNSEEEKQGYHHNNARNKFDNLFEKPLSKNKLDKINGLVTLSMLGNDQINWPRFPHTFDICDIIYCNPITAGSDTLWLHTKFEQLKIYSNPERTQKMFNFLLDYSNEIIDSLLLMNPASDENIVFQIKSSYERLLRGIVRNFSSYNLERELTQEETKKLNMLEEKIYEFNINQPNKVIDPILMQLLTPGSFLYSGEKTASRIEKSNEKFNKISIQEEENRQNILAQINAAVTSNNQDEFNIFQKLDNISYEVYKGLNGGKVVKISDFLNHIQRNVQLAQINKCDYFNIPQEHTPNYNYVNNFLRGSGSTRKNFLHKLDEIALTNPELATAYENIDAHIGELLRQFHTEEGRKNILDSGGIVEFINKMLVELQPSLNVIEQYTVKRYEQFKENTPFNDIDTNDLSSYWKKEVKKSINNDNYDGMVAVIHELLHRIEDKFRVKEIVSGKSFSDLPKKIEILKKMGSHQQHVADEINVLVSRYNYLGTLYDEQNKDKKKYKPKSYRINY